MPDKTVFINGKIVDVDAGTSRFATVYADRSGLKIEQPNNQIYTDCYVIDISGKFIMPGLVDMHTHFYGETSNGMVNQHEIYNNLFLSYGVTSVRSMGEINPEVTFRIRDSVKCGKKTGVDIFTAGIYFDKTPSIVSEFNEQSETIDQLVAKYHHYTNLIDFVKIYDNLPPEWINELSCLAKADNKKIIGHLAKYNTQDCIKAGVNGIEHGIYTIREFLDLSQPFPTEQLLNFDPESSISDKVIDCIAQHDVAVTPTTTALSVFSKRIGDLVEEHNLWRFCLPNELNKCLKARDTWKNPPPRAANKQKAMDKQIRFVEKLRKSKVRVFCGTDPISIFMCPGISLSWEAEFLIDSGFTTKEILRILTIEAAKELGLEKSIGTVETGKKADLVILNNDPFVSLKALRDIYLTVKNGTLCYPEDLWRKAEELVRDFKS